MDRKSDRHRAANFSKGEERLLLRLANSHKSVLENKKTDSVTNSMKVQEWEKIATEFNSQKVGTPRDPGTLRRKYENIKRGVKKKISEEKQSIIKTGGGPAEKNCFNEEEIKLLETIAPQAIGSEETFGGDNELTKDSQNYFKNTNETIVIDCDLDETEVKAVNLELPHVIDPGPSTFSSHVVGLPLSTKQPTIETENSEKSKSFESKQHLMRSPHRAFKRRKRRPDGPLDKITAWAALKAETVEEEEKFQERIREIKEKHILEENKLKKILIENQIKHDEEQHAWRRRHEEEQHEWRRHHEEELHIAKINKIKSAKECNFLF